jgi:hypothetical protein
MDSFAEIMRQQGRPESDVETLGMFATVGLPRLDGSPKPALEVWDAIRREAESAP